MARILLTINGNTLELEGDNEFIDLHLDKIDKIENAKTPVVKERSSSPVTSATDSGDKKTSGKQDLSSLYPFVYDVHEDKFQIISGPRGSNDAEKTRSIVLLYLFGKKEVNGEALVSSSELRDLAKNFGCFDSKNFAATLASLRAKVSITGKRGGSKTYKLTFPGEKAAREMADKINAEMTNDN